MKIALRFFSSFLLCSQPFFRERIMFPHACLHIVDVPMICICVGPAP